MKKTGIILINNGTVNLSRYDFSDEPDIRKGYVKALEDGILALKKEIYLVDFKFKKKEDKT